MNEFNLPECIYNPYQLFDHIIGAIICLIVGGIYQLLLYIFKKYIWRNSSITPIQKKRLIKKVNLKILDRLHFLIDNKEFVDRTLITRVRYLHVINSRYLKMNEVISEDDILEDLLTHVTASRFLSVEEKMRMTKRIYRNADCFHRILITKVLFLLISSSLLFLSLYYILHIDGVYLRIQDIFHEYTEYVVIPLLIIFSMLMSHYIYISYIYFITLKFNNYDRS